MRKVYNFGAGPAMLPEEVLLKAQAEMLDWHGTGISIMEHGHRGKEFQSVADQAASDLRELMSIPSNYQILFLAGGASTQFAMVPMNLYGSKRSADYIETGIWSKKALDEAQRHGAVNIAAQLSVRDQLAYIPEQTTWALDPNAAYVHYTPNETISGVAFHWVPQTGDVPLVADMTSMILSEPVNVADYGLIYAGAQKNIGPAGLNIVIIREDLLSKETLPHTPTLYHYKNMVEAHSFYNTPPTFAWYMAGLVFAWMKEKGGVNAFYEINQRKAKKLYTLIDASKGFYISKVDPSCRSMMNVSFDLPDANLTSVFLAEAEKAGLTHLKGHRAAGGVRASIYNPMPEAGVDALCAFMQAFVAKYG